MLVPLLLLAKLSLLVALLLLILALLLRLALLLLLLGALLRSTCAPHAAVSLVLTHPRMPPMPPMKGSLAP